MIMNRRDFIFTGLTAGTLYTVGCGKGGVQDLNVIPESQEIAMGEDAYKDILSQEKLSSDSRMNSILQRVGTQIAKASDRPDYKWEFKLIESTQVNAWCLPGGKIAVYTGILPYIKNEAGLACVLGHEAGHAVQRHSGKRMSQQLGVQLIMGATDWVLKNNSNKQVIMGAMGAGASYGVILPFSREHEYEADELGFKYMSKAGYDPNEALVFWDRFSKLTGNETNDFASTHPATPKRIENIKKQLPQAKTYYQSSPKYGIGTRFA